MGAIAPDSIVSYDIDQHFPCAPLIDRRIVQHALDRRDS